VTGFRGSNLAKDRAYLEKEDDHLRCGMKNTRNKGKIGFWGAGHTDTVKVSKERTRREGEGTEAI